MKVWNVYTFLTKNEQAYNVMLYIKVDRLILNKKNTSNFRFNYNYNVIMQGINFNQRPTS